MLKNLTTLMVHVRDMPRGVAFYRDVLGLPLQMESGGWSQFDLGGGMVLGLHAAQDGTSSGPGGWTPSFRTDDVRAFKQRLTATGAIIAQDFHDIPGGVTLGFSDPEGNRIDAVQAGVSCADLGVASH